MSTASTQPTPQEVRERAEELKLKILAAFPNVDVEYGTWEELNGDNWSYWEARGFPLIHFGVHACVLIRGDLETSEEAASLADNEVGRLLEETNVVIQVRRTNHVVCKKSGALEARPRELGKKLIFPTLYSREDKRGITFLCLFGEPHEHDWGNVKPQW